MCNPHVLQICIKTTHLLPQCQGLQTYSSHHRGWRLLQQVKWAAWVLERWLLLWPVADGVNCRVQEKGSKCLITPHLHSSSTSASLFLAPFQPYVFLFFEMPLSFIYGSGSSSFSCLWIPFIPCFEVVCLVLLSTPPHSCTWRTRDKIEKQDVTTCSQRVIPRSTIPCTGSNMQSWHRWWLTRTCRCTEWLFLEDRFKSWMT